MVHKTEENNEKFLSKPGNEKPQVFDRIHTTYKDASRSFTHDANDFSKQFAHIYAARLAELREVLMQQISKKWGKVQILKLADLENFEDEQCVIIGTLYKHQQWKPSILRELSEDHQMSVPPSRTDYCSEKDQPFLEDEMLRIKLVGEQVDLKYIVTGVVCAILGYEKTDGTFMVKDWCFPGCPPKETIATTTTIGKLVLLSGLDLAYTADNLAISLLSEWLCGMTGNASVQKEGASITRVVIAGNTVKSKTKLHTQMGHSEGKAQDNADAKEITLATQNVDRFLSQIAQCCCITLMPGKHDPTNIMLPQKPLHPCLLPKTSRLESFKGASNPWIGKVGERVIIGTSGQPITDIVKATGDTGISCLEWLEKTLLWRHICPTAPDTLPAHPYCVKDEFIMKQCPDIYFVGNMDKFETKLWKDDNKTIRLICVPKFSTTYTAVVVDLENLDTEVISFGTG
ncbi:hypothetical protein KM043_017296 [Ampulex compressa]|nr:hypothetical protein KM043_017296 [Ampulex compressa]